MMPVELNSDEFKEAWALWCQHRKEIKKKLTPTTTHLQLRKLSLWGEKRAIASIYQSIENGWQGLFEPRFGLIPNPSTGRSEQEQKVIELSPQDRARNLKRLSEMCQKGGVL